MTCYPSVGFKHRYDIGRQREREEELGRGDRRSTRTGEIESGNERDEREEGGQRTRNLESLK